MGNSRNKSKTKKHEKKPEPPHPDHTTTESVPIEGSTGIRMPSLSQVIPEKEKLRKLKPWFALLALVVSVAAILRCISAPGAGSNTDALGDNMVDKIADAVITESVQLGDMKFAVTDYKFSDQFPDDSTPNLHDGNTLCMVKVSAKNTTKASVSLAPDSVWSQEESRFKFSLIYADGYVYNSYRSPNTEGLLLNYKDKIIPLQTISGYVCFEIPEEVAQEQYPLGVSISLEKENHVWLLTLPEK